MPAAALGGSNPGVAAASSGKRLALPAAAVGAGLAVLILLLTAPAPQIEAPELVTLAPGTFAWRASGEFLRDGRPVAAPLTDVELPRGLTIMKHEVTRADYDRCVAEGACKALEPQPGEPASTPAVGMSFIDAEAYAAWLSLRTGQKFRLPTDPEWALAAGDGFRDDAVDWTVAGENPASGWIAAYEREAARVEIDPEPRPLGAFGLNANGLADIGGNVFEWTTTCFTRHRIAPDGGETLIENCGVRTVEGEHRAYISDFIRDPRGGACSAGKPPANLGMRLVRDDS
jgi:formylglycine-generating enzyme required for sulfatase activity